MEGETGGKSTSTPVASERKEDNTDQTTKKKRTASTSPEKEDLSDFPRYGLKKFARDNLPEFGGTDTIECGEKGESANSGGDFTGNVSHFGSNSSSHQVNTFNTSIFSDDLNAVNSSTQEIFGIKDTLLSDLKELSKKWPQREKHDVACQSNSLLITPLVKTLFCTNQNPNNPECKQVLPGELDPPSTESMANNFSLENNLFLRAIASKIDSMADNMGDHSKSIASLGTTVSKVVKYVEKMKNELSARIDSNKQRCDELRLSIGKAFEYTDTKIANFREAMPLALAEVGGELERRIELQNTTLLRKVQEEIGRNQFGGSLVGGLEEKFREKLSLFKTQTNQRLCRLEEQRMSSEIKTNEVGVLKEEILKQREKLNDMEERHRELNREMKEMSNSLKDLKSDDNRWETGGHITKNEWRLQKQRTDEAHERISTVETIVDICSKKTDSVDLIVRKNNIIIDQLMEIEGEEIGVRICGILGNTMMQEDLSRIKVLRVFRLGVRRAGGPPRKILLEMDNPLSRDIVLSNVRFITRFGNDGKPYYLNDDVPEETRRWKK